MQKMETAVGNWEGEWTTGEARVATTMTGGTTCSCCFDGAEVLEPAQLGISCSHPVDQLLLDGLVATDDCDLRGQTFDYGFTARPTSLDCYRPETSADSRSSVVSTQQAFSWSVAAAGSTCEEPSNLKKRKRRGWSPGDPDPKKAAFTLVMGSGSERKQPSTSTLSFQQLKPSESGDVDAEAIQQMKELMYRAAALRPVNLGAEVVEKPRRKNVRISSDPQTVAARQRRERISERLRVLQKLVPGGCKMDTASMLDEAANYLKFLRSQVKALEAMPSSSPNSHFSANQIMPSVPGFNLSNCFPNSGTDDAIAGAGGRFISMISNQPIPIPIPGMRHNIASNPPFLLHQYAKG